MIIMTKIGHRNVVRSKQFYQSHFGIVFAYAPEEFKKSERMNPKIYMLFHM